MKSTRAVSSATASAAHFQAGAPPMVLNQGAGRRWTKATKKSGAARPGPIR